MQGLIRSATIRINFKWLILLFDIVLSALVFLLVGNTLNAFNTEMAVVAEFYLPFVVISRAISFLIFETHIIRFRYFNIRDILGVFMAVLFGSVIMYLENLIYIYNFKFVLSISPIFLIADFTSVFFILISYRFIIKFIHDETGININGDRSVLIYHVDQNSLFIKKYIELNIPNMTVLGFLSDSPKNKGKIFDQLPVYNISDLFRLKNIYDFDYIITLKENKDYLVLAIPKDVRKQLNFRIITFPADRIKLTSYKNHNNIFSLENINSQYHIN